MSYEKQFWEHEPGHEDDSDYREYKRLNKENTELRAQKELDRQEIERLKEALLNIHTEGISIYQKVKDESILQDIREMLKNVRKAIDK